MQRLIALLIVLTGLAGCAGQPQLSVPPSAVAVASDPQRCDTRTACTTKTSRPLLFVFDYAAAGAPLVQRDGRLLLTPVDAPVSDWPALTIRLAEAEQSAFAFNAQCRAQACRLTVEQLLQIYRSYLADQPCVFSTALCRIN
jgi:predicted small lipoprotein YifL